MSRKPNFIVFLVDDQAWSGTSIHKYHPYLMNSRSDYFETPNLERLAREGVRFTDAYAPAPLCAPARIGIQLGRSPVSLRATTFCGIRKGDDIMQKREAHMQSIPETIKQAHPEYATAHFGKWHIYGHTPSEMGYDESSGWTDNAGWCPEFRNDKEDPKRIFEITRQAADFIQRKAKEDQPFFLQVSHYAVHTPTECRPEIRKKYEAKRSGWKDYDPKYAAMVEDVDTSLGNLLDQLHLYGLEDNTYVIYLSDNGGNACDDVTLTNLCLPLCKKKHNLHEGGIRIPFVMRGPDIPGEKVVYESAIAYDIMPTIADILDIKDLPEGVEGASLRKAVENPPHPLDWTNSRTPLPKHIEREQDYLVWHVPYKTQGYSYYRESAIRRGKYKLLKNWDGDFLELYDLDVDIEERVNLVGQKPELAKELEQVLLNHLEKVDAEMDYAPWGEPCWEKWREEDASLNM